MSEKYFVVGDWCNEDEQCPLREAGLDGSEWASELAEEFDSSARMEYDLPGGITYINEKQAREVWNQIVHRLERSLHEGECDDKHCHNELMFELAEEVQQELGWV